ncbi:hypothetical protein Dvina_23750 [Dactylosporangium vinaceum]|uniref:Uncharacterized protein n=1 Tax=Dactylosporangium vinaceum TaxID=53362 RepID=A0ABV5MD05_9ACTN|nr:hypothetical protein [Dactylosporangium vinaceum]UAC00798.1 hypothetical protein Dvina_23750 [Dactylosporangium vinaceum]
MAAGLRPRWRAKVWVWARRYVPAELFGTACAFLGTALIYGLYSDRVLAAIAGTVGEIVGFYGFIATVEWRRERARGFGLRRTTASTARLLLAEFGLIEILDSTTLRPLFMYLGPSITGGMGTGTLLGKLMADVAFYGVAIVSYELIRRRRRAPVPAGADEDTVDLNARAGNEVTQPIARPAGAGDSEITQRIPRPRSHKKPVPVKNPGSRPAVARSSAGRSVR